MNLDAKINMVGFKIANILDENMINKLLGVLANDGVYAMWVYAQNKIDWSFDSNKNSFEEKMLIKFIKVLDFGVDFKVKDEILKEILDESCIDKVVELTQKIEQLNNEIKVLKKDKNKQKELTKKKKEKDKILNERNEKFNYFFQTLSQDLNQLLFFKEMLEKALIYARYHAKAGNE
jgi:hypothetical protein